MRKLLFIALICVAFGFSSEPILAQCACHPIPDVEREFNQSKVVFTGKIIGVEKTTFDNKDAFTGKKFNSQIKVEVQQTWKQNLNGTVKIKMMGHGSNSVDLNSMWLIYAKEDTDKSLIAYVGCCLHTTANASNIADQVKRVKLMGEMPKKINKKR